MNVECKKCGAINKFENLPGGHVVVCGSCKSSLDMVITHYDVLKVSRFAPSEVITAAYRSLAKMHHPDKNQGSQESTKILQIINRSYSVLSDPYSKAEHDSWIEANEQSFSRRTEEPSSRGRGPNQEDNREGATRKAQSAPQHAERKVKEPPPYHPEPPPYRPQPPPYRPQPPPSEPQPPRSYTKNDSQRAYPGLNRFQFILCFLLISSFGAAANGSFEFSHSDLLVGSIFLLPFTESRFRNMGIGSVWSLISLLPIISLIAFALCFFARPGFHAKA